MLDTCGSNVCQWPAVLFEPPAVEAWVRRPGSGSKLYHTLVVCRWRKLSPRLSNAYFFSFKKKKKARETPPADQLGVFSEVLYCSHACDTFSWLSVAGKEQVRVACDRALTAAGLSGCLCCHYHHPMPRSGTRLSHQTQFPQSGAADVLGLP
jgi:hypothetical protein